MTPQQKENALKEVNLDAFVQRAIEISERHLKPLQQEGFTLDLLAEKKDSVLDVVEFSQKADPYGLKNVCMVVGGSPSKGGYHAALYVPLEPLHGMSDRHNNASRAMVDFLTDLFCYATATFIDGSPIVTPHYKSNIQLIIANHLSSNDPLLTKKAPRGMFIEFQADLRKAKLDINSRLPEADIAGLYLWVKRPGKNNSDRPDPKIGKDSGLLEESLDPKELTMEYLSKKLIDIKEISKRVIICQELCGKPASEALTADKRNILDQFVHVMSATFTRDDVGVAHYDCRGEYDKANAACADVLNFYQEYLAGICEASPQKKPLLLAKELRQAVQDLSDFYSLMHEEITKKVQDLRGLADNMLTKGDNRDPKEKADDIKLLNDEHKGLMETEKLYQRDLMRLKNEMEQRYSMLCRHLGFVVTPLFPEMAHKAEGPAIYVGTKTQQPPQQAGRA